MQLKARFPDAVQHEVIAPLIRDLRWAVRATIPGLQRITSLRSVLRCAREK
jgi:hypothetical protein